MMEMQTISMGSTGPAVVDVQERLRRLGFLPELADGAGHSGVFDHETASAVQAFCETVGLPPQREVTEKVWAKLVDESFEFGDRNLYLRVPFFHGNDVLVLQSALSALGFSCGRNDGIFGAHTEQALRNFQNNMGLPSDGIAGGFTFRAINNLSHSWKGKDAPSELHFGFARAADVLERHQICIFGVSPFTRQVASRMSNLALATNPMSQVVSADSLLVRPDEDMLFLQIVVSGDGSEVDASSLEYEPYDTLGTRLMHAMLTQEVEVGSEGGRQQRIALCIPAEQWVDAGELRSAQHYAITLLDAVCNALLMLEHVDEA